MLIDAHAHLDLYDNLLDKALEEINRHKIFTISNSINPAAYEKNLEIASRCELVLPIFGVHPWQAAEYVDRLDEMTELISKSPMLGEIGLDYVYVDDTSQYPAQRKVFEFFLKAAKEQDKIVNLHTMGAEEEVLHLLEEYDIRRAIVHWYSGPIDILHKLLDRGVYCTVGVEVLFSDEIKNIAREIPDDLLLIETDNPGGLKWLTGEPGMPLIVNQLVQSVAKVKGTTTDAIIQAVQVSLLKLIEDDRRLSEACVFVRP